MAQEKHETTFDRKARELLEYLNPGHRYGEDYLPRPFMVEFTGSPSSGKTTTIDALDQLLKGQGMRVLRPQEGAEVIRHIPRTTPLYNLRTGLYALQNLIDLSSGHQYDIVIFDRGVFDTHIWMQYWRSKGKLSEEEEAFYQQFFLSRFWVNHIDAAYFVVCDAEVAMQREHRISLTGHEGNFTNPETITKLMNFYADSYMKLGSDFPQLKYVNTTHMSEQEMVEDVGSHLLDTLHRRMQARKFA